MKFSRTRMFSSEICTLAVMRIGYFTSVARNPLNVFLRRDVMKKKCIMLISNANDDD